MPQSCEGGAPNSIRRFGRRVPDRAEMEFGAPPPPKLTHYSEREFALDKLFCSRMF
jgi:hypothetical protein